MIWKPLFCTNARRLRKTLADGVSGSLSFRYEFLIKSPENTINYGNDYNTPRSGIKSRSTIILSICLNRPSSGVWLLVRWKTRLPFVGGLRWCLLSAAPLRSGPPFFLSAKKKEKKVGEKGPLQKCWPNDIAVLFFVPLFTRSWCSDYCRAEIINREIVGWHCIVFCLPAWLCGRRFGSIVIITQSCWKGCKVICRSKIKGESVMKGKIYG